MSASISIDTTEFNAALREYVKVSKRTLGEIINKRAFRLLMRAFELTPRADRSTVMNAFGLSVKGFKVNKKTGKIRTSYKLDDRRRAYDLLQGSRVARGLAPLSYAKAMGGALSLSVQRVNSIGTLAAGWVGAIRAISGKIRESAPKRQKVKPPGTAKPAQEGWNPSAEFAYNATEFKKSGIQLDPRLTPVLQQAFNDEAKDMMQYVAERMQKDADRFNAK